MDLDEIPAAISNPERLSSMLSELGMSFRSAEAYEAARKAGIEVSERTLRKDLNQAVDAGLLERGASGVWLKSRSKMQKIRVRIGLALLAAGEWGTMPMQEGRSFSGPTPEDLEETIDKYEDVFRAF
jgi:trimethylamine:corrinoid methyltransferase-like protein